jgi:hypothetical protein
VMTVRGVLVITVTGMIQSGSQCTHRANLSTPDWFL